MMLQLTSFKISNLDSLGVKLKMSHSVMHSIAVSGVGQEIPGQIGDRRPAKGHQICRKCYQVPENHIYILIRVEKDFFELLDRIGTENI